MKPCEEVQITPKRKWQGLTDKGIEKVYETTNAQTLRPEDRLVIFNFARAIEAACREKNG